MKIVTMVLASVLLFSNAAQAQPLQVFAAASLKNALDEIAIFFETKHDEEVVITYGATGTLAKQIEAAAPADVFVSADSAWMDALQQKNLIHQTSRKDIIGNSLVLISAKGAATGVSLENFVDKLSQEKLALAEITSVPAGKYAKAALDSLQLWTSLKSHVVMQENVRSALALVARGEAKFGIVYKSDANAETKVEIVAVFPESTHPPIVFPAAIVASTTNELSHDFVEFLSSKEAQAIFLRDGFKPLQ